MTTPAPSTPESTTHMYQPSHTREQQSAKKRIEQTYHGYVALLGFNHPTAYHSIGRSRTIGKQSEQVEIERQVECQ